MTAEYQDRVVRVFISSTFRDMHAEREELVKYTFPELRRRCRERGVEFVDVDLRWGVTEEQSERGEVLPICLAEIERCHPYFIGLLGERYGWVPEEIDQEIIDDQPWLEEHKEKSVTELEILHGVFENRKMDKRSFFYLRDGDTSRQIETTLSKEPDYRPEPEHYQKKLNTLKESIRDYPNRNFADVKTLGQQVLDDLWAAIDKQFPESEIPTQLEQTRLEHEAFAAVRRNVYIGKQKYFDRLNEHVSGDEAPLVILGESGSGKSALIANWVEGYRKLHPNDFVLMHFIGSSADSTDYMSLLRRIMLEIKAHTESEQVVDDTSNNVIPFKRQDDEDDIPTDPQKLIEAFPLWLAKAAAKGKFILILDGLNQLEDRDNAPDLIWLPQYIPPQVRLIVSTLPGRSLEALQKRDWPSLTIELLDTVESDSKERSTLINDYLKRFSKSLDESQIKRITSAEQSSNPLYLKTLLDELRVFGSYEKLNERIEYYLQADTIDALFDRMLQRLEQDYDRGHPGLTKDVMSLIWASRYGLSEIELLELLDLPHAIWSPLYLALHESLVSRSGLLTFFHDYLRKAVEESYLPTKKEQQTAHLRLADYFATRELDDRKVDDLPWQLEKGDAWKRLKNCIAEPMMFLKLSTDQKQYELTGYWLAIGDRYDMVRSYHAATKAFETEDHSAEELSRLLNEIARFLDLNAKYDGAEPLFRRALQIDEEGYGPQHPNVAMGLNNLAGLLHTTNRHREAEPLLRRALAIDETAYGPNYHKVASCLSLNNLAVLLHATNRYEEAEPFYRRALEIFEVAFGPHHPRMATSLNNLAELLYSTNRHREAEPLFRRALAIDETAYGPDHPNVAIRLNNWARLLHATNRHREAEPLFRRAIEISEAAFGPHHPTVAIRLDNLALLLKETNRHLEAEPLYRRALEIFKATYGPDHSEVATCLDSLALLLNDTNRHEEAALLCRHALEIFEDTYGPDHPEVATSLNNLGMMLNGINRHEESEPLFRRALQIDEAAYGPDHPKLATSLNNLALLLVKTTNRHEEAEPLLRRALQIKEAAYGPNHPTVTTNLNSLAMLLYATNRHEEAEPLFRRALEIDEAAFGPHHPTVAIRLDNLAMLLNNTNRHTEAEPLYRRALAIDEAAYGADHPNVATGLNNLAMLLANTNRLSEAEPLFRRALEIDEATLNPNHPVIAVHLGNLASLLRARNRHSEAEPLLRRVIQIDEEALGGDHPLSSLGEDLTDLAELLWVMDRHEEAEALLRRALQFEMGVLGADHPKVASCLRKLARLLYGTDRHAEAEPLLRRALQIDESALGADHPEVGQDLKILARLLFDLNDSASAKALLERAYIIFRASLGEEHPDTQYVQQGIAHLDSIEK